MYKKNRVNKFLPAAVIIVVLVLGACSSPLLQQTDLGNQLPKPAATTLGVNDGAATMAIIGAAGGVLSTPDGSISIAIPIGALPSDAQIIIQPITNTAHGGMGAGYRLSSQGQVFLKPVAVTFAYTDGDLVGTAAQALSIAVQTAEGYWELDGNPTVDTVARTITTSTSHFSDWARFTTSTHTFADWSRVKQFRLNPREKTIRLNDAVLLLVERCFPLTGERDTPGGERRILGFDWVPLSVTYGTRVLSDWAVNGVLGGNGTVGTIDGHIERGGYTPPEKKPSPSTVTASVKIAFDNMHMEEKALLESKITLIDPKGYTGTVNFSVANDAYHIANGVAHVTWTPIEELSDVRRFVASGTIDADITLSGCDSLHAAVPIWADVPGVSGHTLTVYTASNVLYPNSFSFSLGGDETILTYQCGSPDKVPTKIPAASFLAFFVGGGALCSAVGLPTYTDETILSGTYSCPDSGLTASWTFTQN